MEIFSRRNVESVEVISTLVFGGFKYEITRVVLEDHKFDECAVKVVDKDGEVIDYLYFNEDGFAESVNYHHYETHVLNALEELKKALVESGELNA